MSAEQQPLHDQNPVGERKWSGETEEDQVWSEFRDFAGYDNIIDAISDQTVLPQFRRRALEYSLSDDNWPNINNFTLSSSLRKLEKGSELSVTAAKIVKEKIKSFTENKKSNPREQYNLEKWNSFIIDLVPSLSEKEAEELVDTFLIDKGQEDDSIFSGLSDLFHNEKIDERWKVKAAEKAHKKIEKERGIKNRVKFYRGWDQKLQKREMPSAFERYRENINSIIDRSFVSQEFVQKEIEFMMNAAPGERIIYSGNQINRLGEIFEDKEFVHRLLRNEILNKKSERFWDIVVEDKLIDLCAKFPEDKDLMDHVNALKKVQDEKDAEYRKRSDEYQLEKNAAFAKIRKPQ